LILQKTEKMIVQALVVDKPGDPFVYQDIQLEDTIRDDEVLVEMRATGVCHTDLNFSKETQMPDMFPVVLGHEGIEPFFVTLARRAITCCVLEADNAQGRGLS
jgi:hypothetical protein